MRANISQGRSPIIIIGMHRSGTTLIAKILKKHGVFIGKDLEENFESKFFLGINDMLLRQTISSWDKPQDFDKLIKYNDYRELMVFFIRRFLTLPKAARFMGFLPYLRYRTPEMLPCFWGWKDPRNTITLPLWLDIFSNAKVLHVERNGLDVAQSLMKRQRKDFERVIKQKKLRSIYYSFFPKKYPVGGSFFVDNIEYCVSLWKDYLLKGRSYKNLLGDRFMTIRFEDLLKEPEKVIKDMLDFCEVKCTFNSKNLGVDIDTSRSYAYKNELNLSTLSQSIISDFEIY